MASTHFPRSHSYQQPPAHYYNAHSAHPPPSPPMEESKYSLPSISNLINLAGAGSPTSEAPPSHLSRIEAPSARHHQHEVAVFKSDSRPGSGYAQGPHPDRGLPPTPPMSIDSSFDSRKSPPAQPASRKATTSAPAGYYQETTPPLETDPRRPHVGAPAESAQAPHYHHYPPTSTTYAPAPAHGAPPYPPPGHPVQPPPQSGLFHQRPLPVFSPMNVPTPTNNGSNPWQHHHYLHPSHGPSYAQSQDRYICPTCNKAFSRPSSLRIHCHSHTGEKPFKCPHAGCGKAFSVRSNMKRHERGCHSFDVTPGGPGLPA